LFTEVWETFIENSKKCYIPNKDLTVDEQLLPCKSRCKFTQYMPQKPDKFGIKFWLLAEVKNKYICNGFPYLGAELSKPLPKGLLQGDSVVRDLLVPFYNKGYNCTTDNFFTTKSLADFLSGKGTTLIGTVKKNRRWLPSIVKSTMPLGSSVFYEDSGKKRATIHVTWTI